ncbi:hypothetical protein QYF36_010368 [Acer negundo]|nr:hypothetical protein QYF36_010368 [Acer negundo]
MNTESYDRAKQVQQFDDSKTGVKGLVDSGITTIPRFFIHPPETLSDIKQNSTTRPDAQLIPTIDLSDLRPSIVEKIARASRDLGFFQIVNHGIEPEILERLIGAIKGFHEQPPEIKAPVYCREMNRGVSFFSNVDLFRSKAASWRDTLQVKLGPTMPGLDKIPDICRNELVEWNQNVTKLGELLMELLCEGLGVDKERLKEMKFPEGRTMVAHYYPYCPQPDLTEPRISIAVFFNSSDRDSLFGPLSELISTEKPAHFRQFTYTDYMRRFFTKELDGKSLANYYRLSGTTEQSKHDNINTM